MRLEFLATAHFFILLNLHSFTRCQGETSILMKQNGGNLHSIGSNATVISEVSYSDPDASLNVNLFLNETQLGYIILNFKKPGAGQSEDLPVLNESILGQMNITIGLVTVGDLRTITWKFSKLPGNYNNAKLLTTLTIGDGEIDRNATILEVLSCPKNLKINTPDENYSYEITSDSPGHFGDVATCKCPDQHQVLVGTDGVETNKTATCSEYASWDPCQSEELQCWSAPQWTNVSQVNKTAGDLNPFNCTFTDGYPSATKVLYKVDNVTFSTKYTLKSSDHGKNLSCEVVSNYTEITGRKSISGVEVITVFFPPEKANLSTNSIIIDSSMNWTQKISFYFSANPHTEESLSTHFKYSNSEKAEPVFSWVDNITKVSDTQYTHAFVVNLTSADETETYAVCANSTSPQGGDCAELTFSNEVSPTFKPTDIAGTTFEYTIDAGNPYPEDEGISTGIIIGAAVGVLAVVVIVIAVVYFMRRNHGNIKEERINEIYEASPGPGPSIETVYTGTGENSRSEMTTNVAYEASPHPPGIQDVYTTVNREDKKKGRTEKDEAKNESAAATSAEENVPAVTDVYAMVKK